MNKGVDIMVTDRSAGRATQAGGRPSLLALASSGWLAALLGATVLLALAGAADVELVVEVEGRHAREVSFGPVLVATSAAALGATGWAALIRRFVSRARATFLAGAVAALLVSFAAPAAAASGAAVWWLDAMHVAVFLGLTAPLLAALPGSAGPIRRRGPAA